MRICACGSGAALFLCFICAVIPPFFLRGRLGRKQASKPFALPALFAFGLVLVYRVCSILIRGAGSDGATQNH